MLTGEDTGRADRGERGTAYRAAEGDPARAITLVEHAVAVCQRAVAEVHDRGEHLLTEKVRQGELWTDAALSD